MIVCYCDVCSNVIKNAKPQLRTEIKLPTARSPFEALMVKNLSEIKNMFDKADESESQGDFICNLETCDACQESFIKWCGEWVKTRRISTRRV